MKSSQPPQQPQSKAGTFCKHSCGSPCPCRSLPPQDLGLEGGQGVILHLLQSVVHQVGLQPVLGERNNRDIIWAGNIAICCSCWLSFDPG